MRFGAVNDAGGDITVLRSSTGFTLHTIDLGNGIAIAGTSTSGTAGRGVSAFANINGGEGIFASGRNGVHGITGTGNGVLGESRDNSLTAAGVFGVGNGVNSNGVIARASNGPLAFALWARSTSGFAGVFDGKVQVNGQLTKAGGGFEIDHPLDPENKYLRHSFVESPDALNVYSGNATTDEDGNATVALPEYFQELNEDVHYQLTVIGELAHAVVAEAIRENQFTIKTDRSNVEVSWQVTGVRKDAFASMYRMEVEEEKPSEERGTYLHPEAFDQPETRGAGYAREEALSSAQLDLPDPEPPELPDETEQQQ
jgi:hypothetical protein